MNKKLISKITNNGSIEFIPAPLVIERVAEINNPVYSIDTIGGAICYLHLDEAIERYNNDPTAYAFIVRDNNRKSIEFRLLLFYKNAPFLVDINYLHSLRKRLVCIASMLQNKDDSFARYCVSDELAMFNKCYHFTPQLMDDFRFDLHKNLVWLQELGLNGSNVDLVNACLTIVEGIKKKIEPYIFNFDSKAECVPDPIYLMTDSVVDTLTAKEIAAKNKDKVN